MRNAIDLLLTGGMFLAQAGTPQDEALRLVNEGQYANARPVVIRLIDEAAGSGAANSYRASLLQLLGRVEHGLGRYKEAEQALSEGVELCERQAKPDPSIYVALL